MFRFWLYNRQRRFILYRSKTAPPTAELWRHIDVLRWPPRRHGVTTLFYFRFRFGNVPCLIKKVEIYL